MNISKTWTSKGNEISINVEVGSRGNLAGTITNQAGTFPIDRIGVVQGSKVAPFNYNGKPANQVLPDEIYSEIDSALRSAFAHTDKEILEGQIDNANREYHKALDSGPAEATKWLNEWDRLNAKLQSL